MNRAEKIAAVEKMNEAFQRNPHLILAGFRGLSVNQANALRRRVDEAGGSYTVIQNRLAKRAAQDTHFQTLAEQLAGPCAVAAHETDPVALAKAVAGFAKENPELELIAAVIDAKEAIDADGVKQLSRLPGLSELRAQLLALIQTPATMLVRLLSTPGTQLARVIDARREQQDGSADG